MKKGDKIKISRKGMFENFEGEIVSVSYNVNIGLSLGTWAFKEEEITLLNSTDKKPAESLKTAPIEKVVANDKPKTETKTKRSYKKRTAKAVK